MITLVRSGRSYPIELGLLAACVLAGVLGPLLGPSAPATASRLGPSWLFYVLILTGGAIGLGGIGLAWACRTRTPALALLGVHFERAGVLLVGMEWVAYALAIMGVSGLRGAPVAVLLAGIGGGCLGRAWQITADLRMAKRRLATRSGSPDEPAG